MVANTKSFDVITWIVDTLAKLRSGMVRCIPLCPEEPGATSFEPLYFSPNSVSANDLPHTFDASIYCSRVEGAAGRYTRFRTVRFTDRRITHIEPGSRYIEYNSMDRHANGRWAKWTIGGGAPIFGLNNYKMFDAGRVHRLPPGCAWTWGIYKAGYESSLYPPLATYLKMHLSAMLVSDWSWTVEVGLPDRSLLLLTDPVGLREAFSLRELPEGKARRDALVHWVAEHWRKKPVNEGRCRVQKHKRGKRKFHLWGPVHCWVEDSD